MMSDGCGPVTARTQEDFAYAHVACAYEELSQGKRTIVVPGDGVRMAGLDVTAVASANRFIRTNLPGGGRANAACAGVPQKKERSYIDPDNGESARFVMTMAGFARSISGISRGTASSI